MAGGGEHAEIALKGLAKRKGEMKKLNFGTLERDMSGAENMAVGC